MKFLTEGTLLPDSPLPMALIVGFTATLGASTKQMDVGLLGVDAAVFELGFVAPAVAMAVGLVAELKASAAVGMVVLVGAVQSPVVLLFHRRPCHIVCHNLL
jgi:hypothetical protein